MKEGDRVRLEVSPCSRYAGRKGTVEVVKRSNRGRRPRYFGIRVDGDEGTVWAERLPFFDENEVVRLHDDKGDGRGETEGGGD